MLLLHGDLGLGKTTLVRGLARGLGVLHGVKSPSFAIHLTYPGRVRLHHVDLYRLSREADVAELGLDDVFGRDGVVVVEWGERLGPAAPPGAVHVDFTETGPETRTLAVRGPRPAVARLAGAVGRGVEPGFEGNPA